MNDAVLSISDPKMIYAEDYPDFLEDLALLYIPGNIGARIKFFQKWSAPSAFIIGADLIAHDTEGVGDKSALSALEEQAEARRMDVFAIAQGLADLSLDKAVLKVQDVAKIVGVVGPDIAAVLYAPHVLEAVKDVVVEVPEPEPTSEPEPILEPEPTLAPTLAPEVIPEPIPTSAPRVEPESEPSPVSSSVEGVKNTQDHQGVHLSEILKPPETQFGVGEMPGNVKTITDNSHFLFPQPEPHEETIPVVSSETAVKWDEFVKEFEEDEVSKNRIIKGGATRIKPKGPPSPMMISKHDWSGSKRKARRTMNPNEPILEHKAEPSQFGMSHSFVHVWPHQGGESLPETKTEASADLDDPYSSDRDLYS